MVHKVGYVRSDQSRNTTVQVLINEKKKIVLYMYESTRMQGY